MDIDYKIESSSIAELPNDEERSRPMPAPNPNSIVNPDVNLSEEEQRKIDRELLRRLDTRLLPWLSLLYLLSFLDRSNAGNAKIEGILESLKMSDSGYNVALSMFFVGYAALEPVANVCLKAFRPPIFLSVLMMLCAVCMTFMGFCTNEANFIVARFFLGVCEAGLFPGVLHLISCWYRRSEIGIRMAVFFSAASFSGSFGGLLAAAITQMDGVGGKPGWAWIFIIEGLATFVVGVISFWAVPPFPDDERNRFLSDADRARVRYRLAKDAQASANHEKYTMAYFWNSVKDWKTYTGMLILMGNNCPMYAFSLFLPTITSELGYSNTQAQFMSVPPYAVAAIATICVGYAADRLKRRGIFNVFFTLIGIAGFLMMMISREPKVKYAGTFLGALGIYPANINSIAWVANNVEGVYKRGVTLGIVIGWGNLQGIVSSHIFRVQDAPQFYLGNGVIVAYLTLFTLGGTILQYVLLSRENERRRRGEMNDEVEGLSLENLRLQGDNRPDFLYTL